MSAGISGHHIYMLASLALMSYWAQASEIIEFNEPGTAIILPGPALRYDVTYIWTVFGPDVIDSSTPCLSDLAFHGTGSCDLGTVTFQPPKVTLPPGSTIVDDGHHDLYAGASLNISGLPPNRMGNSTESVALDYHTPTGDYSESQFTDGPLELSNVFDNPVELLRTAASSTGLLPPVVVDIRMTSFFFPYPKDWDRGPVPLGTTVSFSGNVGMTGSSAWAPSLAFDYELAPVPEPSTAPILLLGAVAFALRRVRRQLRS